MSKKLKIKFWKAEKALAMQILEQKGLPKCKLMGSVRISLTPCLFYETNEVYLRGQDSEFDYAISSAHFESNQNRDAYLNKITQSITDELFSSNGELKVGEMCEVSKYPDCVWKKRKLIAILPDNYRSRFITQSCYEANNWFGYKYARPLAKCSEPMIEECGDVTTYTWEEK